MESVGVNVIEIAALGRPFQLGMLYDCRTDALIPGIRLWTKKQLEQNSCPRPQIKTRFSVTASDTIKEKSNLLEIHGELKLSFLGGLLNVSGAADYLKDTKSSFNQQRLTLHYHSSSRFEELTVNHLPSEKIPEADSNNGTHVVTGILYGADACFVFDRKVSSDEDVKTVKGEVKVAFEKLQDIISSGNAEINMNENQKDMVKNLNCTFYGDFQLQSNPTSFEDALNIFADLPKLLKEPVPLRVWLYPLDKLLSIESKLLNDISLDLIMKTEAVIESLNTAEMKCCDLLRDSPVLAFAEFHDKISQMKQNYNMYKLRLVKKLGSLLPNIRGDLMKETALNDLVEDHNKSPFRECNFVEWLKERERESGIIKSILRQLKDVAETEVNLDAILMDLEVENLVSYTFTSLNCSDELILQQTAYLSPSTQGETDEKSLDSKQKSWLTPEIQKSMKENLRIFKNLIDSKDRKPAKFIVSFKEMKNNPGSCILLYEGDCDEAVCFTPPSQPVCPTVEEVNDTSVVLKVPPSCPDTVELRLLYKPKQDSVWRSEPILKNQDTVTLTDLSEETEYEFKCAALGKLDYTRESDVIHLMIIKKLILATDSIIDDLSFTENKCNDLLQDTMKNTFSAFQKRIEDMKRFCQNYRQNFSIKAQSLIQSVQACEEEPCVLTDLLQAHEESPFNTRDLNEWITGKEKELNTVGAFLQQLLDFGAEMNLDVDRVLSNIEVENVVCYTFSSLEQKDVLISEQENYLNIQRPQMNPEASPRVLTWLTGNVSEKMREKLLVFKELMTSHGSQSRKFFVTSGNHENHPGSCIIVYEHGREPVFFSPPSQPARPIVEKLVNGTAVLKVPPSCPATVERKLLFKPKQDSVWRAKPILKDQDTVTLTNLRDETEYEIKCAALGKLGYTRESDVTRVNTDEIIFTIKGSLGV